MAATLIIFDEFINNLAQKLIDLDSDTFKAVLTNVAPSKANDDELADITQIAAGNGYTTGGVTLTSVTYLETAPGSGIWQWTTADFSWTASGGNMAAFRYIALYSDTSTGDKLIGYIDYGAAVTVTDGNMFTVDVGANGHFRIGQGTVP